MKEDFDSYVIEDEEEEKGAPRLTMWSIFPRIMTMPTTGWEMLRKRGPNPDVAAVRFLLPICLLAGGSNFFRYLYPGSPSFAAVLVEGVISLCGFFLGYYISLLLERIFMPKEARDFPATAYGKLLNMVGIATLALFYILAKALPMLDVIFEFLPLWTIFLIYVGMKNTGGNEEKHVYSLAAVCIIVICSPYLVNWILSLFV